MIIPQFKSAIDYFNNLLLNRLKSDCWLVGGAPRDFFMGKKLDNNIDLDLFFPDENNFSQTCLFFSDNGTVVFENSNAKRYKVDNIPFEIDCVKIFSDDPNKTINNADFTVNSIAINKSNVFYHETFFVDLAARNLILNRELKQFNNIFVRIYQLITNGFDISNSELKLVVDTQQKLYSKNFDNIKFKIVKFFDTIEKKEIEAIRLESDTEVKIWLDMAYLQVCLDIYRYIVNNEITEPKIKAEVIEYRGGMFERDRDSFLENKNNETVIYINDQQEMFKFDKTRYEQISVREESVNL